MSEDIRSRSVSLLVTSLSASSGQPASAHGQADERLSTLSAAIESAVFSSCGSTTGNEYRDAIRQRSLILKKDNTEVGVALIKGQMDPQTFATASTADLQTPQQSLSDAHLQQDNIRESLGMTNNYDDEGAVQPGQPVSPSQEEYASGQVGVAEDMLGGEGEFASRKQPKVGKAMEGIEFETP